MNEHQWERDIHMGMPCLKCFRCGLRWLPDQFQPRKQCKP